MPTYDFRCTKCATTFEVNRPMSTTGDVSCPVCGETATKVFAPVGVAFKGTGFHNTDYRPSPAPEACSEAGPACAGCPSAE
jgi:putative FmdB family regulatory protein